MNATEKMMTCPVCGDRFIAEFTEKYGTPSHDELPCSPECNLKTI